jgi:hypothetical protein
VTKYSFVLSSHQASLRLADSSGLLRAAVIALTGHVPMVLEVETTEKKTIKYFQATNMGLLLCKFLVGYWSANVPREVQFPILY